MENLKHKKCLICESIRLAKMKRYYSKCGLVQCLDCHFVFMENIPTENELKEFYNNYGYENDLYYSPSTLKSYNLLLDEFEKYRKTNKILDIGCGRGWFLIEAKKRGWEVYGTEYSELAISTLNKNDIITKKGKISANSFQNDYFDVITSFEVIEHINNPMEELNLIYKFLRKGGLFYCTTPNFNSIMRYYLKEKYNFVITYPEHLSYYTRGTLSKVVTERGFKKNKILSTGLSISIIKISKGTTTDLISNNSNDEILRKKINKSFILKIIKKIVNSVLTKFGLGITLKGYFIKN